jgi:HK97 family phage prohead protease
MTTIIDVEPFTRDFATDLSIRADGTGRTVAGIVVPYDTVARVSDGGRPYDEAHQRGSFAKAIADRGDRVPLMLHHDRTRPIGKATLLREDAAGLYGEFAVSNIPEGDQAIELVRDGVLDSFSIGFVPVKSFKDKAGVTIRTENHLREASLVTFPAFDTARITALRAALSSIPEDEREALLRDLIPDATEHVQPAPVTDEPIPADHSARDHIQWQAFRLSLREKGIVA